MVHTAVTPDKQNSSSPALGLPVLLAFLTIYVVWGSTYFAIRVAVNEVPPLFAAGIRFVIAGAVLYLWSWARGTPHPSRLEWRNLATLGGLMFLCSYSALFWAEKTVPSGIASVLVATIPVWTGLLETFVFKRTRAHWSMAIPLLLGLAGVCVLAADSVHGAIKLWPCLAILGAQITWSIGTVLSKVMTLPSSKSISAGAQMLTGGIMLLTFSLLVGELNPFPRISANAAFAIGYLTVAGSLLAFTAFVWLLGRLPATQVSSYAYVNPVVALLIGHWLGNEVLNGRVVIGAALVLASVLLILRKGPATH